MRTSTWECYTIPNQELYEDVKKVSYTPGDNPLQTFYMAIPKRREKPFTTIVWVHGGGLTEDLLEECPMGYEGTRAVVAVRYRIAPANPVPDPLEDVAKATAWTLRHIAEYGGDPARVVLAGMSAGAWLAAMIGMAPEYLAKEGIDHKKIAGMLLLSGQMTTHFRVKIDLKYPGENGMPAIDRYAPIAFASKDVPPILTVTGARELDMAGRASENMFFADTLRQLGHRNVEDYTIAGCGHCLELGLAPILRRFLERIGC